MKLSKLAIPALILVSGSAFAALDGTKHDLSNGSFNNASANGEICVYCHAPHNPKDNATAPLWNKTNTVATYTPYTSTTLVGAAVNPPGAASLACLTCHDGTVAADNMWNPPGNGGTVTGVATMDAADFGYVGINLTNDHPVGTEYSVAAAADNGLNGSIIGSDVQLYGGKVECASCHDVHNTAVSSFLVATNANSAICTACHAK